MFKKFHEWLRLREAESGGESGGGMGVPGTPFPDGQKPSDSKWLGKNKNKLDNSGMSGGPGRKSSGGGAPAPAAPA